MIKINNLIGQKFGRLTVLAREKDYISPKGIASPRWLCQCECGKQKIVHGNSLKSGKSKSCGCYRNEMVTKSKSQKMYIENLGIRNSFREENGLIYVKLKSSNKEMICDIESWEILKYMCWRISEKGYAKSIKVENGINKVFMAHRIIVGAKEGDIVDHINRDRLDNRRKNLRIVNAYANAINRKLKKENKTGYAGVRRQKKSWIASITIDGKWTTLGHYNTFEEAVEARRNAEIKIYGINSQI